MRRTTVVMAVVIAALFFSLHAFSWGIDVLVHDGPITCFDVDYSMDGELFVVFQKDQSPSYPICCVHSVDRGRTWTELWCLEVEPWRLPKLEMFIGEYRGEEMAFVFYVNSDGRPTMLRAGLSGDGLPVMHQLHVGDYRAALGDFDVARSYHVELGVSWPPEPLPEPEPSYDFSIVFMWRDMYANDVYFFRSIDGGDTWSPVHAVMSDSMEGDTAGLAITWGPPDTYYYVYKGFCGTFCCYPSDSPPPRDWRDDPRCYAPYWGYGRLNGYPGMWTPGRLVHGPTASTDPEKTPDNYHSPVLAASFDPANPALWLAFINSARRNESSLYWRWTPPAGEGTGWRYQLGIGGEAPEYYFGDVKGYRELGNPYLNMAEVSPEYYECTTPVEGLQVQWRWETATGLHPDYHQWLPQVLCVNDYNTIGLLLPARPKLLYSPGSDPGGAGIVYVGYDLVQDPERPEERIAQPGLFFDAPWFYPVDAFDRPGEPYSAYVPEPETSEHPVTAEPDEIRGLDVREGFLLSRVTVSATTACAPNYSHELTVCWSFECGSVTVRVEGPDGLLIQRSPDQRTGCETFHIDLPEGGTVTVTVTARSITHACNATEVKTITLPPC